MYIQKVIIENIRSISHFEMDFPNPAGWHVLIGDNGTGKSSIVRAISLALMGPIDAQALRLNWSDWIQKSKIAAAVSLVIARDNNWDKYSGKKSPLKRPFLAKINISRENEIGKISKGGENGIDPYEYIWSGKGGWFSASFGPFRRFTGGDKDWSKVYYSNPAAAAHLSIFGEDVALTESLEWLKQLKFQSLEQNQDAIQTLSALKKFINQSDLLPNNMQLDEISSSGVSFRDGNGNNVDVTELSDGFRSILSLMFELIRQLIRKFGQFVFVHVRKKNELHIDFAGVVLIDEIDAHLHPTWQTRIGQWFTQYFPNIQFIVTTHSPLVCRACEKGSIWRLAAPGSEHESGEITGVERERLIYGNILDAYGTEAFGEDTSISVIAAEQRNRLGELYEKSIMGLIEASEQAEFNHLKGIFPTFQYTGILAK